MLDVRALRVAYTQSRRPTLAIAGLTFGVAQGEFVAIVGPSGCGKTSLLRVVAGLLPPTSGQVLLHGRPIAGPPKEMAMVFQDYGRALCAWRSALGNVGFALEALDLPRAEKLRLAREALRTVGLAEFERHYPWELSGGMQQRLQIARALAYGPQMLLLDEPFGSLDALTRAGLEDELLAIWTASPKTILMVTHDIEEAVYLSDRILLLSARPARLVEEVVVDLPRPRDQLRTRADARFVACRSHVFGRVMAEVQAGERAQQHALAAARGG